jgi:hypothetical protein
MGRDRQSSVNLTRGEDAWFYVMGQAKLIAVAARLVKPGGLIAFTEPPEASRTAARASARANARVS